ncbi:MAG: DinB family protein [Fimbriimonadaceae bacterium]|nr:DinB family protein [Fimbriimonadaceae bacterium]
MRVQEFIVRQTQKAVGDFFRAVEALPPDRIDWKPEALARSALSQAQEVALAPPVFIELIELGADFEFSEHAREDAMKAREAIPDLASAREMAMKTTGELCAVILSVPDERLEEDLVLPFGGGARMTLADVMGLHAWNTTYHYGQVNYIQTLLGDMKMH